MRGFIRSLTMVTAIALSAATRAGANGELNTFTSGGWSPNSDWFALNWPDRKELFIISAKSGLSYTLLPVGASLEMASVFSSAAPTKTPTPTEPVWQTGDSSNRATRQVPSAGHGKLTMFEWATDSHSLAYSIDRERRGVFSLGDEKLRELSSVEPLPWAGSQRADVSFEFVSATETSRTCYIVRALSAGTKPVKQLTFTDLNEMRQVGTSRYRLSSYIAQSGEFMLYPRVSATGWQLMQQPVRDDTPPHVVWSSVDAPYEWKLSGDGRYLAVADAKWLTFGALADWENARKIAITNMTVAMAWSPDAGYLAFNDRQSLYAVARDSDQPVQAPVACSQRFWGWRGTRLYFAEAATDFANLCYIEPARSTNVHRLITSWPWSSATRDAAVSPDSRQLICLTAEVNDSGKTFWQLWRRSVPHPEEWQSVTNQLSGGFVIQSPAATLRPKDEDWTLLYSVPARP